MEQRSEVDLKWIISYTNILYTNYNYMLYAKFH